MSTNRDDGSTATSPPNQALAQGTTRSGASYESTISSAMLPVRVTLLAGAAHAFLNPDEAWLMGQYGIVLDPRHGYTKSDWEISSQHRSKTRPSAKS